MSTILSRNEAVVDTAEYGVRVQSRTHAFKVPVLHKADVWRIKLRHIIERQSLRAAR
jgi:hypothetical protein